MKSFESLKCKTKNCNNTYMINGFCTKCYLKLLDKFESNSRKIVKESKKVVKY